MEHNINLNIHYSAPKDVWEKIGKVYATMPYWIGSENGPQWMGENVELWASVEPSGIQFAVYGGNDMINKIKEKLKEIEIKENIRILHCIESGSRAWGFASPDSDYDVRFIYIRPYEEYLRLDKTRDTIEWELNDVYDINGWDFKKVLQLLHNSNPTLFEWSASPIVYKTTDEWRAFAGEMNKYFLCKAGVYHYISTAKGNYREYLKGDEVRLKKYFYVLRPILACRWILDKTTPPPMPFEELVDEYLSGNIEKAVRDLIKLKRETPEIGTGKKVQIINDYIDSSISEIEMAANNLPISDKKDWEELNNWFLRMLKIQK